MSLQIKALTSIAIIVVTQLIVFLSELKINKKDPVYMEVNRRRNIFIYAFNLIPPISYLLLTWVAFVFNLTKAELPAINSPILAVISIMYSLKLKYKTPIFIILGLIPCFFMRPLWFVLYAWLLVRTHRLIKEKESGKAISA